MDYAEDSEIILDDEYLAKQNVSLNTSHASLLINMTHTSLLGLHELLPNLVSLKLDHSTILSLRDLGTKLAHLKILHLNDCNLTDLDGVGAFPELIELSAEDNSLTDMSCLAMHNTLNTLILSRNKISSISITDSLGTCCQLRHLYLQQNPIVRAPHYRDVVAALAPLLETLDGQKIDRNRALKVTNCMILEAASAMSLIEEEIEDEQRMENAIFQMEDLGEVLQLRQQYSINDTESNRIGLPDTGSELTYGSDLVLAGSASIAMRRRKNKVNQASKEESPLSVLDMTLDLPHGSLGMSMLTHPHQNSYEKSTSDEHVEHVPTPVNSSSRLTIEKAVRESATDSSNRPSSAMNRASPRQINSSRPQSAAMVKSRVQTITSPPLKVVHIDEGELANTLPKNKAVFGMISRSSSRACSSQDGNFSECSDNENDDDDDEEEEDDDDDDPRRLFHRKTTAIVTSTTSQEQATSGTDCKSKRHSADKAGFSLGFDLTGSLAAISEWAKDTDDVSDDEDAGSEGEETAYISTASTTAKYGSQLYRPHSASYRNKEQPLTYYRDEVLSREVIMSMCAGDQRRGGGDETTIDHDASDDGDDMVLTMAEDRSIPVSTTATLYDAAYTCSHDEDNREDALTTTLVPDIDIVNSDREQTDNYLRRNKLNYKAYLEADAVPAEMTDFSAMNITDHHFELPVRTGVVNKKPFMKSPGKDAGALSRKTASLTASVDSNEAKGLLAPSSIHFGRANSMSNEELIEMLRRPPKLVPELCTRSAFQKFFCGIREERMRGLLHAAYSPSSSGSTNRNSSHHAIDDSEERLSKVEKRVALLKDLMT